MAAGLHKSDQQYLTSAKDKAKKPNEEFLYATTASKRAERQRLVRFIRSVMQLYHNPPMLNATLRQAMHRSHHQSCKQARICCLKAINVRTRHHSTLCRKHGIKRQAIAEPMSAEPQ